MWRRREWCGAALAAWAVSACAPITVARQSDANPYFKVDSIPPNDAIWQSAVLILGEQHDAPAHHALQAEVVAALIQKQRLHALLLEMADAPHHTEGLAPNATAEQVQARLAWTAQAWPWPDYAEAIMAAVRAGIPVRGANLKRADMGAAMQDQSLDTTVSPATLAALRDAVKTGHCDLLPESQWAPMARIQIAKDRRMAATIAAHVTDQQTVVMLCGSAHADKRHGIPVHLPSAIAARTLSIHMRSANHASAEQGAFDREWLTPKVLEKDYCAELRERWGKATR